MVINTQITLLPQNHSNKGYYVYYQLLGNDYTCIHINFKNLTFHMAISEGNISITYFHKTRKLKNAICADTAKSISTVYLWSRTTRWFVICVGTHTHTHSYTQGFIQGFGCARCGNGLKVLCKALVFACGAWVCGTQSWLSAREIDVRWWRARSWLKPMSVLVASDLGGMSILLKSSQCSTQMSGSGPDRRWGICSPHHFLVHGQRLEAFLLGPHMA